MPDIERVKMFEDCFKIDAGGFSMKLGLDSLFFPLTEFTGIGFIITFEFFLNGPVDYSLKIIEVRGPVGISFDAFTISGGFFELAFSLSLCSKFFRAFYFRIF